MRREGDPPSAASRKIRRTSSGLRRVDAHDVPLRAGTPVFVESDGAGRLRAIAERGLANEVAAFLLPKLAPEGLLPEIADATADEAAGSLTQVTRRRRRTVRRREAHRHLAPARRRQVTVNAKFSSTPSVAAADGALSVSPGSSSSTIVPVASSSASSACSQCSALRDQPSRTHSDGYLRRNDRAGLRKLQQRRCHQSVAVPLSVDEGAGTEVRPGDITPANKDLRACAWRSCRE